MSGRSEGPRLVPSSSLQASESSGVTTRGQIRGQEVCQLPSSLDNTSILISRPSHGNATHADLLPLPLSSFISPPPTPQARGRGLKKTPPASLNDSTGWPCFVKLGTRLCKQKNGTTQDAARTAIQLFFFPKKSKRINNLGLFFAALSAARADDAPGNF